MYFFLELNNGYLTVQSDNKIKIIKLGKSDFNILHAIVVTKFCVLGQLWDGTLIGCSVGELFFFKEKNNIFNKAFGIYYDGICKFITQKKNEVVYIDYDNYENEDNIIFFDYVDWREKGRIKGIEISYSDLFNIDTISKDLLYIITEGIICNLNNVHKYQIVNSFDFENKFSSFYPIKGKYLFISDEKSIKQYKIEQDNIKHMNECEEAVGFQCFVGLKNGTNAKIFVLELFGMGVLYYWILNNKGND